jgi:hypothetical protein
MRAVLSVQQRAPRTYGVSRSPICSSNVAAVDQTKKNRHRFVRTMGSNCGGAHGWRRWAMHTATDRLNRHTVQFSVEHERGAGQRA